MYSASILGSTIRGVHSMRRQAFTKFNRNRQKGWTLAEFGLVTVLMIVGVAAVFGAYAATSSSAKERDAFVELGMLQNGVHSIYAGQGSYTGVAVSDLIAGKIVNGKYLDSAGTGIIHPFNGDVTIAVASVNGGTDNGFTIAFADLPAEACVRMATKDMGSSLAEVSIGGTAVAALPVTVAQATTACGTTKADVSWTFL